jgi:hypothetical protein
LPSPRETKPDFNAQNIPCSIGQCRLAGCYGGYERSPVAAAALVFSTPVIDQLSALL